MVHRTWRGAKAAAVAAVLGLVLGACGTVDTPVGSFGGARSADAAALDPTVDRLAFLAPLYGGYWEGVVGEGEEELAVRLGVEPVLAGRLARVVTLVAVDGGWATVIEGHLGWDPTIERVRYRAWSVDGAYFDGVAQPLEDGLALMYDVASPSGSARFERRYHVDGGATCTRRTRRVDDEEFGPWTEDQVLRRAVRSGVRDTPPADDAPRPFASPPATPPPALAPSERSGSSQAPASSQP